jgi:hypothetical protein
MRSGIAKVLLDQLNDARHKHLAASQKFNLLIADVPSGTPEPDASLQIQKAAAEARTALQDYMKAMERSADFMVHVIVQVDLKPADW